MTCGTCLCVFLHMCVYTYIHHLVILVKGCVPFPVCKVHPQLRWVTALVSQEVHVLQSKPVLSFKVAKAPLVVIPVALKVHTAILSLQQYCPPSSVCLHVTIDIEWAACIDGVNSVGAGVGVSLHLDIITVGDPSYIYACM